MAIWIPAFLAAWLIAGTASAACVGLCRVLAPRWGFLDIPLHEAHKRHRNPVPVLGGLGMLAAFLLVLGGALLFLFHCPFPLPDFLREVQPGMRSVLPRLFLLILCSCAACLLGMKDDHSPLKALPKFGGQLLIAAALSFGGFRFSFFHWLPGLNHLASIFWILLIFNALNFFDNMDGLAAGTCAIAAAVFLMVACVRGQYFVGLLSALTGGVATGFYLHNRAPAKIFMGDGGSHFLGVLLAVCGILTTYYVQGETPTAAPLLIPLCALGVPLFDTFAVICIRLRLGVPVYKGDNRHISHRFEHMGFSRGFAVCLVHLLCLSTGLAALTLLWLPLTGSILMLLLLATLFTMISLIQFALQPETAVPCAATSPDAKQDSP